MYAFIYIPNISFCSFNTSIDPTFVYDAQYHIIMAIYCSGSQCFKTTTFNVTNILSDPFNMKILKSNDKLISLIWLIVFISSPKLLSIVILDNDYNDNIFKNTLLAILYIGNHIKIIVGFQFENRWSIRC